MTRASWESLLFDGAIISFPLDTYLTMADVETQFKKAVYLIKNGPKQTATSNEQKLGYYKYYKQVNSGIWYYMMSLLLSVFGSLSFSSVLTFRFWFHGIWN